MRYHDPIPTRWTKSGVEKFGASFAGALEVQPGSDLNHLVEDLGGEIIYGCQARDEYNGGSIVVRDYNDFTIYLSELTSPKRDRFTIAHELGHLALHYKLVLQEHGSDAVMRATREKRANDPLHERAEWEANWFAAGFLMPAEQFIEKSDKLDDGQLATYFDVSAQAISIRKKTLGV